VINPQNGHILCDPKSPRRAFLAKSFLSESAIAASKTRRWTRKGCKTEPTLSRIRQTHDDTSTAAILSKIAQFTQRTVSRGIVNRAKLFLTTIRSEQFRSAILLGLGDHEAGDEYLFSLFQVL
jgi:hypothetical protein